MNTQPIQIRYSVLAEDENCCLSCGNALSFSQAKPGEYCADLGSGKGTDVIRLAEEVGEQGFVYGIDITDEMLEKGRKNAAKLGVTNVEFIKCELEDIQIPSETLHLVISNCTINHATDKFKVWKEISRMLKKGGRFVVSDIYATNEIPAEYSSDPALVAECWAGAITKDDYLTILQQLPFKDIEILEESKPYRKGQAEVVSFTIAGKKKCCG